MATRQETVTKIGAQNPALGAQLTNILGTNIKPVKPITVSDLQDVPSPAQLVPQTPATGAAGMLAGLETGADQYTKGLEARAEMSREKESSAFDTYLKSQIEAPTATQLEAGAYSQAGGVDDIQMELDAINQQILQEQQSYRRKVERLQDKGGGLAAGLDAELNNLETEALRKQADLSIIQMGVQGRFDSAKAIADRAVQAQVEQQTKINEALRLNYERNKEMFDKDEQRAFETAQNDRERKLDQKERELKEISDLSIQALTDGAPASTVAAMRAATTPEEAIRIGGRYIGSLDRAYKTAQIQKIGLEMIQTEAEARDVQNGILSDKDIQNIDKSPQGAKLTVLGDLKLKMNAYQNLVKDNGIEAFGENKAKLDNAYKELQLSYKEAANLGVLNGPDLDIVEAAINSASGIGTAAMNIATGGQTGRNLIANLEQAQTTLNTTASNNLEQLYARNPRYQNSLYVESLVLPFGEELVTTAELEEMDNIVNQ